MNKAEESSKKTISYPVKILYWNGIPQIRPDGGDEEELFLFLSQFQENTKLNITLSEEDINTIERISYQEGYKQAEKDINKEMMDRMAEIREKQEKATLSDMNYDIRFDPSVGFDVGSAVVYHNDKVIDELTWKDMQLICRLMFDIEKENEEKDKFMGSQEYFEEILQKFKEAKK